MDKVERFLEAEGEETRAVPDADEYVSSPLLTIVEAARYLGVGKKTLYQLIEWGEVKTVRVLGSDRLERESLDIFRRKGTLT